jgi:nucleoside-triphosphatase THEP1
MVIIVTGAIGIGKTTVCQRVIEIVRSEGCGCGGILTHKASDKSIVIEDIETGEKEALASINNIYKGPHVGKYFFNPKGIEFGIQAIDRDTSAVLIVIDEIGYLELQGEGFAKVLELTRAGKMRNCILVMRSELLPAFLSQLPTATLVFETTRNNRDQLPQEISAVLFKELW